MCSSAGSDVRTLRLGSELVPPYAALLASAAADPPTSGFANQGSSAAIRLWRDLAGSRGLCAVGCCGCRMLASVGCSAADAAQTPNIVGKTVRVPGRAAQEPRRRAGSARHLHIAGIGVEGLAFQGDRPLCRRGRRYARPRLIIGVHRPRSFPARLRIRSATFSATSFRKLLTGPVETRRKTTIALAGKWRLKSP